MRFKPDGSAFEQYSSRGGNTWGLDITWDGQVFWTQPTSGTVFFHTVLPESVLAKGKLPATTSWKGMITGQTTYPRMSRPEQAYVQIDQVGQFTAAAGCAIYDGGAWPAKWRYSYFTGEPTLNIVHHQFVKPDGVSYTTEKEAGREQTEFMRSGDMWFRPIETRVGPDGALYVVDFYNQAVIHNDTRGPQHGPANAAVRPDRDHYFGRIWRVQHKQATKLDVPALNRTDLAGLIRAIETSPNAHVRQTAWRLAQENHAVGRAAGEDQEADGQQRPGALRAGARRDDRGRAQSAARHLREGDRQLDAVGDRRGSDRAGPSYVASALAYERPQALTELVAGFMPAAAPGQCRPAARLGRRRRPSGVGAQGRRRPRDRADGWRERSRMDAATTAALQKLLDDPATTAAALPIVAKWDKAGAFSASAERYGRPLVAELGDAKTSDDRRAELAASLLGRSAASRRGAERQSRRCSPTPDVSDALKGRIITTLGESAGSDVDAVMVAAFARTSSTLLFDQILRRPDASVALLAALEGRTGHAGDARTRERRAIAHASEPAGGAAGGRAPRYAQPGGEGEERDHRRAHARGREARRCREREGALHRHVLPAATSSAPSARVTSDRR